MLSQIKLYILLGGLAFTIASTAFVTHKVDNSRYLALELSYKEAETKAIQQALDRQKAQEQKALIAAKEETIKQREILSSTKARLDKLQNYVKNSKCITYGLLRVVNAAAKQTAPESFQLPRNKTDFDCSSVSSVELSKSIITNYGTANRNSEQLNALISYLQKLQGKK